MLRTSSLRVLDGRDTADVLRLCDEDPVANVFVASRVQALGADPWRLGAELWGHFVDGELDAVCHVGANLNLVQAGPEAVHAFADRARRQGRRCSTIVGPAEPTALLWSLLEPVWGPARDVRPCQPLMSAVGPPLVPPDPRVRRVRLDEVDALLPACVAMFTEEVGISPVLGNGGALYRARVAQLVAAGRAYARFDDAEVVFKAEIGELTSQVCLVQGVWVPPHRRGEGLSVGGMAALVCAAQASMSPVVTLYVNDYNQAARAAYRRVGFVERGAFMSVLF